MFIQLEILARERSAKASSSANWTPLFKCLNAFGLLVARPPRDSESNCYWLEPLRAINKKYLFCNLEIDLQK